MSALLETKPAADAESRRPAVPADRGQLVTVDPLQYPGWDSLLAAHPESSIFHTAAWARVLTATYGHVPAYFCRFAEGRLEGLLPVMVVSSPFTGRRGVSLPFTDLCLPLTAPASNPGGLYDLALKRGLESRWRYLECRGSGRVWTGASPSLFFHAHVVDLERNPETLFKSLDGAVRRGIRKAEHANLKVEFGSSRESVRTFYALHCHTRRRHGLPPQPVRFFANIGRHILEQDRGFVVTARLGHKPVAAAIFLHHGRQAVFKFGASDYAFQDLRPNNLVLWAAMKRLAERGCASLHLGRTSLANDGLRRFKLGFGAREQPIAYYKYDFGQRSFVTDVDRAHTRFNPVFRCLPPPLLRLAGALLYPHLS